jgi:DNA-binding HxlR family transcriptional regulator
MTKKEKKNKKTKKAGHLALAAEATPKHAHAESKAAPKSGARSSAKSEAKVDALVREIIERIADKWTMVVLDVLAEHGTVRFTQLGKLAGGVSQKMLTKTVRQMESDGLVKRTVHPVVPPRVEYQLTDLGQTLGEAFCGVWLWAEKHYDAVEQSRASFQAKSTS